MREEDASWFARWEEELPSPEELTPISQTLITPNLALAFGIKSPYNHGNGNSSVHQQQSTPPPPPPEFGADSSELGSGGVGDEPARTLKRPRLVWTPQLHKRFVDAVAQLGIKNAVPKTIMQLMSVDGLTRENVASHLQKYRLYLKRMQGLSTGGGNGGGGGHVADPATDRLFASSPVPAHFLSPNRSPNADHHFPPSFLPLQHQHTAAGQYQRPIGQYGSPQHPQLEHSFLGAHQMHGMATLVPHPVALRGYAEDLGSGTANSGRKVLTLFPTAKD